MFILKKSFKFDSAHRLPNYDGKCKNLHGHTWELEVECQGIHLNLEGFKVGMLIDYGDIGAVVKPMLEKYFDHLFLNNSLPDLENPTSEEIARWIYNYLKPSLPSLFAITIHESPTASCRYEES
jgi:6-pyruvoyltetrahydropterin/6-carboxytetrahydropterin synthase